MGNAVSSTYFAGNENVVNIQSLQPCHLFGDADLYGYGVQCSFYVQYGAAILAFIYQAEEQLASLRLALTVTATAVFISLCTNSTGGNLGIVDWSIANALVVPFPIFTVPPLLFSYFIHWLLKQAIKKTQWMKTIYGDKTNELATEYNIVRTKNYIAAVTARKAAEELEEEEDRVEVEKRAFEEIYNRINAMEDKNLRHTLLKSAHGVEHGGGLRGENLDTLRQNFFQAHSHSKMTRKELETILHDLETYAGDMAAHERFERALQKVMEENGLEKWYGSVALAMVLLAWIPYMAMSPYLYFKLINRGRVEECAVKIVYWFVPVSLYNKKLIMFLRITSIMAIPFALLLLTLAIVLFAKGYRDYLEQSKEKGKKAAGVEIDTDKKDTTPLEDKNLHNRKFDSPSGEPIGPGPSSSTSAGLVGPDERSSNTERAHTPVSKHSTLSQNDLSVHDTVQEIKKWLRRGQTGLYLLYTFGLVFTFPYTVYSVTRTIKVNHIDLDKAPFSSTGQLMPFVTALAAAILVVWECFMKRAERRERKKWTKYLKWVKSFHQERSKIPDLEIGTKKRKKTVGQGENGDGS